MAGNPVDRPTPAERAQAASEKARLTFRRLTGLDRSGPPPAATRRDAPWHVWTIPNAIGFFRAALIPLFLVLALSSEDGTDVLPAILFAVVAWGDYADGIAARLTGQYSKFGAVMDPVIDRMLVLAGVIVVWKFETLPHWALVLLLAREVFQLFYGQWALRHGIDLYVNWPGRIAVWPLMSSLFAALLGWELLGEILLYIGLVFALIASAMYVQEGMRKVSTST